MALKYDRPADKVRDNIRKHGRGDASIGEVGRDEQKALNDWISKKGKGAASYRQRELAELRRKRKKLAAERAEKLKAP